MATMQGAAKSIRRMVFLLVLLMGTRSIAAPSFSACSLLFLGPPPNSSWLAQHVVGFEMLTPGEAHVLAHFIRPLRKRFAKLPKESRLHIISEDQQLTDLSPFAALKDRKLGSMIPSQAGTAWGERIHNECRGYSWGCDIAVGREQFRDRIYGEKHIAIHELAHLLHNNMSKTERVQITKLYENAKKRNIFLDPYSALNEDEYFAEAIETYFATTRDPERVDVSFLEQTLENLKARDPKMAAFLRKFLRDGKKSRRMN